MRYFLDTEFMENGPGRPIRLLSIGMVSQDGREFYAISEEAPLPEANPWVWANVMPHLTACGTIAAPSPNPPASHFRGSLEQIRRGVQAFCDPAAAGEPAGTKPEFWGYYADYDWVVFCQMFGRMVDLPKGFPMFCRDIKQLAEEFGNPELPKQTETEHNALYDARWNREAWMFLRGLPPVWAAKPCNHVHATRGACLLELDHLCDHVWLKPEGA